MIRTVILLFLFVWSAAVPVLGQRMEKVKGKPMYTVLPFDAIPSIDAPVLVDAADGDRFMSAQEMVIGIVDGGEARAYSAWHLDRHEIVNDVINGVPIAVTW
jgi:hypothetical protein